MVWFYKNIKQMKKNLKPLNSAFLKSFKLFLLIIKKGNVKNESINN